MSALLREQWVALRSWLDAADVGRHTRLSSGLGDWDVGELVAHLGLGLRLLTEITPAPPDAVPLSLGRYVAAYPPAADGIATLTRELAGALGPDVLAGIDEIAERAWTALDDNAAPVVMGRRGPITLEDYVLTRLLELVVHGDDLHRALPDPPPTPVLEPAAEEVAAGLAAAYRELAGGEPVEPDPMAWIRLAAGRVPSDDPRLPLL